MNWYTTDYRPTLWGTLSEMAVVSLAIWRDYRDCARAARRRARQRRHDARQYVTPTTTGWHHDWALIGLLACVALCVAAVVLIPFVPFEVLP